MTIPTRLRRWSKRIVLGVVVVAAAHLGGVVVSDAFPARTETAHYRVEASLDASPWRASTIRAFTTVGDVSIRFRTYLPAPGVEARPQIKQSLLGTFGVPGTAGAIVPGTQEVTDAGERLVVAMALRYLVGVAAVVALVLAATHLRWRGRPRHALAIGLAAGMLAAAYTAGSSVATYRPDNVGTYRTTELLATLQSSPHVLESIQSRAGQVQPYIANWLQVQQALQERFVSPDVAKADTVRFLLVSDIHGTNEYAVMKQVIDAEKITAVIDTGDLLNFGVVSEGQLGGIYRGIAGLGVPYVFVDGNHDAGSATDHELLDRLRRIRNVILPEPTAGDHRLVSIGGVHIAGMDDPRFYGDANVDNAAAQKPAAAAFDAAFRGVDDLDIALAHEPGAIDAIDVGTIRIHGHLHRATLDGSTIGVGSFTGGGLMSYYRTTPTGRDAAAGANANDDEPTGQPQAFDILRYNADCSVNALQRLVFSDLIQGAPKYDSITVVNGSTITGTKPTAGRRCVVTEPTTTTRAADAERN